MEALLWVSSTLLDLSLSSYMTYMCAYTGFSLTTQYQPDIIAFTLNTVCRGPVSLTTEKRSVYFLELPLALTHIHGNMLGFSYTCFSIRCI